MDSAEIDAWCKRKQLACENAIVLSDVNSDVTDDVLIQALSQVKAFGKAEIIDRCLDTASKTQFVLIKTSTDLTKQTLPGLVGLPGEAGPWPVHVRLTTAESEGFEAKLMSFLRNEVFRKVFDELSEIPPDDDTHKRGTVWFTQNKPVTLRPGGVARVTGVPKFQGMPSTQAILVDSPDEPADELRFPEQLMVSRRVLRRRRKKQNTEKTQEIDKESETVENRLDATARTDDTDSESEEHGMWFDLFVEPPRIKMDEKVSEPFSLDLDVLASDQTGQPEEVEPEAIQEGEGNDVGCEETVNDTETQETSQTENQIQGHETADADTLSQEDTVTDTDNNTVTRRTQRVRRPPLKLTYDVPGQPSVKMAPSVKYVSCLYKWIGVPMIGKGFRVFFRGGEQEGRDGTRRKERVLCFSVFSLTWRKLRSWGFFPTYRSLVICLRSDAGACWTGALNSVAVAVTWTGRKKTLARQPLRTASRCHDDRKLKLLRLFKAHWIVGSQNKTTHSDVWNNYQLRFPEQIHTLQLDTGMEKQNSLSVVSVMDEHYPFISSKQSPSMFNQSLKHFMSYTYFPVIMLVSSPHLFEPFTVDDSSV
ncbi:uncharacterized protein V6R79_017527 [Siganus canaliculatus]